MKQFVIMIDYGSYEGFKIHGETDDHAEAVKIYTEALGQGSPVRVFESLQVKIEFRKSPELTGIDLLNKLIPKYTDGGPY